MEHNHEHTHTYTHSHPHDHASSEGHDHQHEHEHDHEHVHHHHHEGAAPAERLHALMNYLVSHNTDHTKELEHLAESVKATGKDKAYELTMEAIRFYNQGNEVLTRALEELDK